MGERWPKYSVLGLVPEGIWSPLPPPLTAVEEGASGGLGPSLIAAMNRVTREEVRRGEAEREAQERSRVVVRAPAPQFRQCDAREPTTGACCALPSGHLEPHRGPFAGCEMQWPYESECGPHE